MLAQQCRNGAACGTQFQLRRSCVDDADMFRQRRGQNLTDAILQRGFTPVALQQVVERGFAFEDLMESSHGTVSAKRSASNTTGEG